MNSSDELKSMVRRRNKVMFQCVSMFQLWAIDLNASFKSMLTSQYVPKLFKLLLVYGCKYIKYIKIYKSINYKKYVFFSSSGDKNISI